MKFQPGQVANPNGRPPKGRAISDILGEIGQAKHGPVTKLRALLSNLFDAAIEGDRAAAKIILPYIQPEPKEMVVAEDIVLQPIRILALGEDPPDAE
jgi:hypothetical protein